jgi:glycosyltransferase involved in cell wall biosynthesis
VGRLCEQKGQVLLVEAIGRLKEEGCFAELVLVGDGDMRPEVEAAIDRNGVADRCRITGWASAEEVRESIYDARALVLPSFAEGLPVVLMEALALGRPVITTWIAGIPELVVDGETGFLVPPSDVDALAARIRRVLDANLDELADIAQRGAERVRAEHDIRKEARKLAQIITSSRQGDGSGTNVS